MEKPRTRTIWTSLTPPPATVNITDLILASFLTETLPARCSARTRRRGRRTWTRRRAPRPPWTWSPPRWADRTQSSSPQQRMWCQVRDPLVTASNTRWDKTSNFTNNVGKFSYDKNHHIHKAKSSYAWQFSFNELAKNAPSNLKNLKNLKCLSLNPVWQGKLTSIQ